MTSQRTIRPVKKLKALRHYIEDLREFGVICITETSPFDLRSSRRATLIEIIGGLGGCEVQASGWLHLLKIFRLVFLVFELVPNQASAALRSTFLKY